MTGRFAGKRAIVTGASRGIGAGIAQRLSAEGANVAIVARTADHHPTLPGSLATTAAAMAKHGGVVATIVADLADEASRATIVPNAVEALGGPIDILVNNAAAAIYHPLSDYPLKRRRLTFEVNVHTPIDLAQAVLPDMVGRGAGWIVNLSSASANRNGLDPTLGVYGASKAALNRITEALAVECAGTGVRINTIEPRAAVLSEGAATLMGDRLRPDQIESMEQMVEAVVALCDCPPDRTGQVLVSLDLIDELALEVRSLDGEPLTADAT